MSSIPSPQVLDYPCLKASIADRHTQYLYRAIRNIEDVSFLVNRDDDKVPVIAGKAKELDGALLAVAIIFGVFGALVLGFMAYIIHRVKHRHLYMQVIYTLILIFFIISLRAYA